jgi:hypothetical protein
VIRATPAIWIGTPDGLYRSDDGGAHITKVSDGAVSAITIDRRKPQRIVAGGAVLRVSTDGGPPSRTFCVRASIHTNEYGPASRTRSRNAVTCASKIFDISLTWLLEIPLAGPAPSTVTLHPGPAWQACRAPAEDGTSQETSTPGNKAEEQRPKEQSAQARADHVNPRTEYRLHKE